MAELSPNPVCGTTNRNVLCLASLVVGGAWLLTSLSAPALDTNALRVPGFTAYLAPERGARVSERKGVVSWQEPATRVLWYGQFQTPGSLVASVELYLPAKRTSRLRLTVGEQSREATVEGAGTNLAVARFGRFDLARPGYQSFILSSLNAAGTPAGDIDALTLTGPAVPGAHFNLQPRRNAASVHLRYPVVPNTKVAAFYCEVTGVDDPVATYYMACGWHRGYFGMQVNSPTERRIIFSVWDSGKEPVDRNKVAGDNRVALLAKGDGVFAGDFGNEGTGGHSHLTFAWKTGERQRFLVTAQPTNETFTIYSGYYFHPDTHAWMLISSWRAPQDGGWMRGLYSFSENFGGSTGHLRRKALFGNQWIRSDTGTWTELTTASFSHDRTGREDRLDRFMGLEHGEFFLSHGGFVEGFTKSGATMTRPATGQRPSMPSLNPAPAEGR